MDTFRSAQWFVYQQDYFWFLAAAGWTILLLARWRMRAVAPASPWLPWAGGAGIATALLEVSQMVTPVKAVPNVPSYLAWDLAVGGVNAAIATALWWHAVARDGRLWHRCAGGCIGLVVLASAVWRSQHRLKFGAWNAPEIGSWMAAGVVVAAAVVLSCVKTKNRAERIALAAVAGSVLLGSAGPIAEGMNMAHRVTEVGVFGLVAGILQLVAVSALGWLLYSRTPLPADMPTEHRRSIVWSLAAWLAAGLVLAAVMGRWARDTFERNLLARAELSAKLIDTQILEAALNSEFRIEELIGHRDRVTQRELLHYRSANLTSSEFRSTARILTNIEAANQDAQWALILTVRGGWLLNCCNSTRLKLFPNVKLIYGTTNISIQDHWVERKTHIVGPTMFPYGRFVQSRAPLVTSNGRMLGWLVFDYRVALWLSAQVQARLLAFAVVGIGGAFLVANWLQRERQRQREAAAAANRLKTTFLAKVSHELRTPIQSLLGYSELLRQRVQDDAKASAWLSALQQHGELMTRLVNDLIDLSAVEAGAFRLSLKPVCPVDVVAQVLESFRPAAEAKGLALRCVPEASAAAQWVSADGERLRQIATNLIGNAIKFTDSGAVTVMIGFREVASVHQSAPPVELVLAVRDTGPGVPVDQQSRLFQPFSRLETSVAKEGSGLGLALSAALCRAHGGSLAVESDGSTGSTFTALLRAEAAARPAVLARSREPGRLSGQRILVIDDNALVRELFVSFLSEHGALCASAATGAAALAQTNVARFDSVVLDLALPDRDGADVARELRRPERNEPRLRIVGVSAHAASSDRARALAAGMDVFLTKPVALADLGAALTGPSQQAPNDVEPDILEPLRRHLAEQFRTEAVEQRDLLQRLVADREWPRVRALAHYLKNSAFVVRDEALFDACHALELAAATEDPQAIDKGCHRCVALIDPWLEPPATPPPGASSPRAVPSSVVLPAE